MRHFVNGARRRQFEDYETQDMVHSALKHYDQDKRTLRIMRGARGYRSYFESWVPEVNNIIDEVDLDSLRERFVKKLYDDRFDEALPYVYQAHQQEQLAMETAMAEEFASWANGIHEDNWNQPDVENEQQELDLIMDEPLAIGQDGLNAIAALENIIGDDSLNQDLTDFYEEVQDPDADARPIIINYLKKNHPNLAAKYQTNLQPPQNPEQPEVPNQTHAASTMDEPVVSEDSVTLMRKLAGLVKK